MHPLFPLVPIESKNCFFLISLGVELAVNMYLVSFESLFGHKCVSLLCRHLTEQLTKIQIVNETNKVSGVAISSFIFFFFSFLNLFFCLHYGRTWLWRH